MGQLDRRTHREVERGRAFSHLGPGAHELIVRAWDSAGCTQPEDVRQVWNWKGYVNNAWHRVNVVVQ
jgi:hypothetical protein